MTLRAQFDALGIAVRAGVDPQAARTVIGLPDTLRFTGAVPVSLRQPLEEAHDLEEK